MVARQDGRGGGGESTNKSKFKQWNYGSTNENPQPTSHLNDYL